MTTTKSRKNDWEQWTVYVVSVTSVKVAAADSRAAGDRAVEIVRQRLVAVDSMVYIPKVAVINQKDDGEGSGNERELHKRMAESLTADNISNRFDDDKPKPDSKPN